MNQHVPKERLTLADGTAAAVRVTQIPSDDPGAIVLQFESWESDAEDAAECPPLRVTLPLGMLAQGDISVDGVLATTKEKVRKQVENTRKARAALARIPAGRPGAGGGRTELAAPAPPAPKPAPGANPAPLPEGVKPLKEEKRP